MNGPLEGHSPALGTLRALMAGLPAHQWVGQVTRVQAIAIESRGPRAALGELCEIRWGDQQRAQAEVIGLCDGRVTLMPYGETRGLTVGSDVVALAEQPSQPVGPELLGRVVDAFGRPLDGHPAPALSHRLPLRAVPLNPLLRRSIAQQLVTGLRAIDGLLPLGRGQRLGIFAGSGIGKSSLLGMLARHVQADVNVVALIGERGREVQDFLRHNLPDEARGRTVMVVATSDQPAVVRARAAYAATAMAEYFRDQGQHVFLLMDSVTRFAMARREIDLAAGHPPTARGYTPSVFAEIPALCERCGHLAAGGSVTAMYTVLVEGDDHAEPIADTLRATLDGQIVLSRELANEGHYPAIDLLRSISRLERQLIPAQQYQQAQALRQTLALHHRHREMVDMGLYKSGSHAALDEALDKLPRIHAFLRQGLTESASLAQTRAGLQAVCPAGRGIA